MKEWLEQFLGLSDPTRFREIVEAFEAHRREIEYHVRSRAKGA